MRETRTAGYGETHGEDKVLSDFQNYLAYKEVNPSKLKATNENINEFLDFVTGQRQPSDDEDSGESAVLLFGQSCLQQRLFALVTRWACTAHLLSIQESTAHALSYRQPHLSAAFAVSSRGEAGHDIVDVLSSSDEAESSTDQSTSEQVWHEPQIISLQWTCTYK